MINIRKATREDIPRLLELYEELTKEKITITNETIQQVFAEITNLPHSELLVADNNSSILGTVFLQIIPNLTHNGRPWAVIENVVVDNRHHRTGIGRLMMEYAFARCEESACYKVQLLSNKTRKEAHQFYLSLGFEESALGFRKYFY